MEEEPRNIGEQGEQPEQQPSTEEILSLIQELQEQGFDYEDEDIDHISQMEPDEAFSYLMVGLAEMGIDPEEFLAEKGYAIAFEPLDDEPA